MRISESFEIAILYSLEIYPKAKVLGCNVVLLLIFEEPL